MKPDKVATKHALELLKKRGVVMVGLGTKKVGGEDTGKLALVVGVKEKLPLSALAIEDVVPEKFKGLDTDVVTVGEIKLL